MKYWTQKREYRWYQRLGKAFLMLVLTLWITPPVSNLIPKSPLVMAQIETVEREPEPDNQKDMLTYIKTMFGKEWKTAYAIAKAESGMKMTASNVWEDGKRNFGEHSVCIFQINIRKSAHYDKVPGKTLNEKELWLISDYRNCILMAKIIRDGSGWYAWTAYTNGSYLRFMK